MITTRRPAPSVTPVGLQGERRPQIGNGHAARNLLAASRLQDRARRGRLGRMLACAFARANWITWARVGKSRSLRSVARNIKGLPHGREHLRLLHGVDAEVGFEIQVQVEHILRIAGLSATISSTLSSIGSSDGGGGAGGWVPGQLARWPPEA